MFKRLADAGTAVALTIDGEGRLAEPPERRHAGLPGNGHGQGKTTVNVWI